MKMITRGLSGVILGLGLLTAVAPGVALADATGSANPSVASPGEDVAFFVQCENTSASSATLFGATLGLSDRIPMTDAQAEGSFNVNVTVPDDTLPGHYDLSMDCSDGSSTTAGLTVTDGNGPPTGGGGLALSAQRHHGRTAEADADSGTGTGQRIGWALAGGVLVGGLVTAVVVRRRRDRSGS